MGWPAARPGSSWGYPRLPASRASRADQGSADHRGSAPVRDSRLRRYSVEDIAREARVTTGALYHHFATKAAVFEAVFEQVHADMLDASVQAAAAAAGPVELLTAAVGAFLDQVLEPEVQRIIITDAPAVLGLARFTELDERYAYAGFVAALQAATDSGALRVDDPGTLARLLLGALTRAGLLIASSAQPKATRDAVAATMHDLISGFAPRAG